ncbi:hypothetical protein DUP91_29320, partial [Salmonella enterica subsp. enterica]|nr:hypothetical protein [Salmonella enterica subsp. enterica]
MTEGAGGGDKRSRIEALRDIAANFVQKTMTGDNVRVAVVPYSDYVNVGVHRRNAPWANVPADYVVDIPATSEKRDWIVEWGTKGQLCDVVTDGKKETVDCSTVQFVRTVPEYTFTYPAYKDYYNFYGCFFSRLDNSVRLNQGKYGSVKYNAFMYMVSPCKDNELLALTSD